MNIMTRLVKQIELLCELPILIGELVELLSQHCTALFFMDTVMN